MQNSQEDEFEAYHVGFRTLVKVGYHKDPGGRFHSKLLEMEERSGQTQDPISAFLVDVLRAHPPSRERAVQMNQLISARLRI